MKKTSDYAEIILLSAYFLVLVALDKVNAISSLTAMSLIYTKKIY